MITPEIDWWIKNTTQVKKPVYNKKQYLISDPVTGNAISGINQDQNILLVLITDILVSFCGKGEATCNHTIITDLSLNKPLFLFQYPLAQSTSNLYLNRIDYLQDGERLNINIPTAGNSVFMSVGYITISQKT